MTTDSGYVTVFQHPPSGEIGLFGDLTPKSVFGMNFMKSKYTAAPGFTGSTFWVQTTYDVVQQYVSATQQWLIGKH